MQNPNHREDPFLLTWNRGNMKNHDFLVDYTIEGEKLKRFKTDTMLRKYLVFFFLIIIFLWLAAVVFILCLNDNHLYLHIPENVLITLLTTTSINVIGMMMIILRGLFPKQ